MVIDAHRLHVREEDGGEWFPVGARVHRQVFTASGTWVKPAGVTHVRVRVVGGGAGGMSGAGVDVSSAGGSSGGGGGMSRNYLLADDLTDTVAVTVGAGGAGGVSTTNGRVTGTNGGASAFGPYVRATGGLTSGTGTTGGTGDFVGGPLRAGTAANNPLIGNPGATGGGGAGQGINSAGNPNVQARTGGLADAGGGNLGSDYARQGDGGDGGNASVTSGVPPTPGQPGKNYGGGGGGGGAANVAAGGIGASGGAGAPGVVEVLAW